MPRSGHFFTRREVWLGVQHTLRRVSLNGKRRALLTLLSIILLSAVLRFYDLGGKSLRGDEVHQSLVSSHGVSWILRSDSLIDDPGTGGMVLGYLITHFFMYLGKTEFVIRFPSAIVGILGIVAIYLVGGFLFDRTVGLVSAFLLCVSPFHIFYSQDGRPYILLLLLSLLSLLCLFRAFQTNAKRWWLAFAVVTTLNIYNRYFALLVLASEVVFAGILIGMRGKGFGTSVVGRGSTGAALGRSWQIERAKMLLLSLLMIAIACLPSVHAMLSVLPGVELRWVSDEVMGTLLFRPSLSFVIGLLRSFSAGGEIALLVYAAVFVYGLLASAKGHVTALVLALIWWITPFTILLFAQGQRPFADRFVIFMLPMYSIFVAYGMIALSKVVDRSVGSMLRRPTALYVPTVTAALVMFGLFSFRPISDYYASEKQNCRDAASFLGNNVEPGEAVVVSTPHRIQSLLWYKPDLQNVQPSEGVDHFAQIASSHEGVWFVRIPSKWEDYDRRIEEFITSHDFTTITFRSIWGDILVSHRRAGLPAVDDAIALLESAVDAFPQESEFHLQLADALVQKGENEAALREYARAVELDPSSAAAHAGLGSLYHSLGRLLEAATEYQQAIEFAPNIGGFHIRLGDVYRDSGRLDEASKAYQEGLKVNPAFGEQAWYHLRLAGVYRQNDELEAAIQEYERVLELDPENPTAKEWLANLRP